MGKTNTVDEQIKAVDKDLTDDVWELRRRMRHNKLVDDVRDIRGLLDRLTIDNQEQILERVEYIIANNKKLNIHFNMKKVG